MGEHERDPEARIIYGLMLMVAVPVIVVTFVSGEIIGPGTTICMVLSFLGIVGIVADLRRRARVRVPVARVVRGSRSARVPPRPQVVDASLHGDRGSGERVLA